MITHRTSKAEGRFTQVANALIQDTRLSLKARGLLVYLLSLPPKWKLNIKGLVSAVGHDGRDLIAAALRELVAEGYVVRTRSRSSRGQMLAVEYEVHEEPVAVAHPQPGSPDPAEPVLENPTLCNTKANNTVHNKTVEVDGRCNSNSMKSDERANPAPLRAYASEDEVVGGFPLRTYAVSVDAAILQNLTMAQGRHWSTLDASVRGNRSFSDVFGSTPCVSWTTQEYGYLKEMIDFCVQKWPQSDPLTATAKIVRAAFLRKGKAHQFLKYWIAHCGSKVTLRPFLTLGGGGRDVARRRDILVELAAGLDPGAAPTEREGAST